MHALICYLFLVTPPMQFVNYQSKMFILCWAKESSKFWVQSNENSRGISVQIETPTFVSSRHLMSRVTDFYSWLDDE